MNSLSSLFRPKNTLNSLKPPNLPNPEIADTEIADTEIADRYMIPLRIAKKIESLTLYYNERYYYIYKDNYYYFSDADNKKKFLESLSILLVMEKALESIKVLEIIKILENGRTTLVKKIVCENKISNKMIDNFISLVSFYRDVLYSKSPIDGSNATLTDKVLYDLTEKVDKSDKTLTDKVLSDLTEEVDQEEQGGGKLKKGQKKIKSKKSVVSQNKENKYKDVLGKRMKIYEKPDSRKEFVRYKGELVELVEYKKSMKEIAKKTKR